MSAAIATELAIIERRTKVVDLAKTGKSYRRIAEELGIGSAGTVAKDIAAWAAETKPSAEATEELRKLQCETIDALHDKLWPMLDSDDYLAVVDRLVKLMDRKARLMGLDLERSVTINLVPTAEQIAGALGWDDAVVGEVVEGTAVELPAGDSA